MKIFYRIRIRILFVNFFLPNTNNIRQKFSNEYEYEYYSSKNFHRIRIRILFGLKISPNTNTNNKLFEYIRIYSNIFKHRIIPSLMKSHAKKLFKILAFFVTFLQLILPQNVLCIFLFSLCLHWIWKCHYICLCPPPFYFLFSNVSRVLRLKVLFNFDFHFL